LTRPKASSHGAVSYDEIIKAVFQFVLNSDSRIGREERAPVPCARDLAVSGSYATGEKEHQEVPGRQMSNERLAPIANMSNERRLGCDLYQAVGEKGQKQILKIAIELRQNPREIGNFPRSDCSLLLPIFSFFKMSRRLNCPI
jgi:hypothetical protein